jgi:hypothetical protein
VKLSAFFFPPLSKPLDLYPQQRNYMHFSLLFFSISKPLYLDPLFWSFFFSLLFGFWENKERHNTFILSFFSYCLGFVFCFLFFLKVHVTPFKLLPNWIDNVPLNFRLWQRSPKLLKTVNVPQGQQKDKNNSNFFSIRQNIPIRAFLVASSNFTHQSS